jgi:protein-disulfide isomerase
MVSPAAPPARRTLTIAILVLAAVGLALSIELTLLHARAAAGGPPSFCSISEEVNCDKVAASAYSTLLGVPLAAWGALAYGVVAGLGILAVARRRPHPSFPAVLLVLVTALLSATAVALAIVSQVVIRSLCLLCAGSWLASFALLVLSWRLAAPGGGAGAALRADLAALRRRPGAAAAAAGLLAAGAVGLLAGYSRAAPARPAPGTAGTVAKVGSPGTPVRPPAPRGPAGSLVIFEYSDYACPFCARVHETNKPLLAARPDVRVVRRHFPLDMACNAMIKRPFHVGSCALARAGICAEAQGRFEELDDLLFANQAEKASPEVLAQRVGLDLPRFEACLVAPETEQRLQSDIAEGLRAGLRGTPSYEWNGRLFQGDLAALLATIDAAAQR